MVSSILNLTAAQLVRSIASGDISGVEATRAYLEQIHTLDGDLHAFNEVWEDSSLGRARQVDAGKIRGPLAGLPIAIKDNLCTVEGHTTCSSRILMGYQAPYTATAVDRLLAAGAIIVGKTNMDEFAMGSSTETSATGPTRNPWNTSRVPGGSSGGSAASVAARMAPVALGSDTGGSIRLPAAFCGVVGLKPTYGRVSRYGLIAYGSSLDQIGPISRDSLDAALILGVIAGADRADSTSIREDVPDYSGAIDRPLAGLRIGLPKQFYTDALDPEVGQAIHRAADVMRNQGAVLAEVDLPHSRIDVDDGGNLSSFAVACYYIIAMAEASSNLSRYDGVQYGHRTARPSDDIIELYSRTRSEGFGDEVKRRIMLGTFTLSSGYYDAYYLKALKVRRLIKRDFDAAFGSCDILLCPVSPGTAFRIGEKSEDPLAMYLQDIYTLSVNLCGLPAIALPCGQSTENLPIGMQFIGPVLSEGRLLRAARMYETATGPTPAPQGAGS
jgi:aspartyl-tRNA(Asn)/glutamyl-tRNA(Gln) amidotransferase subunit A